MNAVLEAPTVHAEAPVKNLDYYLKLPYTIEMIPEEGDVWFARMPELPGCMTEGDGIEDTIAMIHDAQKCWIEASLELGREIPEPQPIESYSGKFNVRIPKSLHRDATFAAEADGVSLNQFVNVALAKAVASART